MTTESRRTPATDPAAKTRVIVAGILIALAWLLSAATVVALVVVLPEHHVRDYAWAIIGGGIAVAGIATFVLSDAVTTPNVTADPLDRRRPP